MHSQFLQPAIRSHQHPSHHSLKFVLARLVAPLLTAVAALPLHAADFGVTVENITELNGLVLWTVYDSETRYTANKSPLMAGQSRVIADTLRFTLHDLPPGDYAVKLFHDANGNGKLDANALGLPQEGYGFSNNAGHFGPASFSDAAVKISNDTQITIRLR